MNEIRGMIFMCKVNKLYLYVSSLFCLLPLIISIFIWGYLPDEVVIHFDVFGNPNLQGNKFFAFIVTPILFLMIHHFILYLFKNHRRSFGMEPISINYYYVLTPVISLIVFLVMLKYSI